MQMVRGEKRYAVIAVDGDVLTLANHYGATFVVSIPALVANGYRLECATDEAMPDWWPERANDAAPQETVETPKAADVSTLFDF